MQNYIECLVKKESTSKDIFKLNFIIIISVVLILLSIIAIKKIGFLVAIIIGYFAFRELNSLSLEFEYIITEDIVDIDKIINKSRRKSVLSFELSFVNKMEKVSLADVKKLKKENAKILNVYGNEKSENIFLIDVCVKGKRYNVLFEPSSEMVDMLKIKLKDRFVGRN